MELLYRLAKNMLAVALLLVCTEACYGFMLMLGIWTMQYFDVLQVWALLLWLFGCSVGATAIIVTLRQR